MNAALLCDALAEAQTQIAMTAGALTLARTCGRKRIVWELQCDLAERLNLRDSLTKAISIVYDANCEADRAA